jgi:hypothetical protein
MDARDALATRQHPRSGNISRVCNGPSRSSQKVDFAVIVSHDCDIAANPAIEPVVEAIPGVFVEKEDGSLPHAKETRRLHLGMTNVRSGQQRFAEFRATDKLRISKRESC